MKHSIILDILNGVKGSRETITLTKVNKDNIENVADGYDMLKNHLTAKQMKHVDNFLDACDKCYCEEIDSFYIEGFKMGLLIGIECFEGNE